MDKTMAVKFVYIPNDDSQIYLAVETFKLVNQQIAGITNRNSVKVPKVRNTNKNKKTLL